MKRVDPRPTGAVPSDRDQEQPEHQRSGGLAAAWRSICAAIGVLMGLVPHVLHHVGILAGTAFVAGTGGNLLFGILGLLLSVPLFRRLYRRFNTWKAPAIALAVFVAMFSLSAFVIGPAISDSSTGNTPAPETPAPSDHGAHHGG